MAMTVAEIIQAFQPIPFMSREAMARHMGIRSGGQVISAWIKHDRIPGKHWAEIVSLAEKHGVEGITLEALAKHHGGK